MTEFEDVTNALQSAPPPTTDIESLWPGIQSRIEQAKIVALRDAEPKHNRPRAMRWSIAAVGAVAAAGIMILAVPLLHRSTTSPSLVQPAGNLTPVADSVQSYEAEARVLLNHLEVQRAMMRPEAAAAIDRDLKVIDSAIDELKLAIANDPNNPALRRLLASSYRQKVELLKRAGNAG